MTIIHDPVADVLRNQQIIQSIVRFQQEQESLEIAKQTLRLKQIEKVQQQEYQANNDLLAGLWTAMTDKGTPPEVAEHFRIMADSYGRTMVPQQRTMLDITIARGLYSDIDRKRDTYKRIYGERPQGNLENLKEEEMIPKMAELKVAQYEWDYGEKAYLAGGKKNLPEGSEPKFIPIIQFMGKDNKMHNIYARKDNKTGLVQTFDTGSDIDAVTYGKALEDNWSPSMMAQHDFIPLPGSQERIISADGKKYSMRTGTSLSDGSLKALKLELGDDPSEDKDKLSVPSRVADIVYFMNSYANGDFDEKKLGKYGEVVKSFKELEDINIRGTDPQTSKEYMGSLLKNQVLFNKNNPGWVIAPYYDKSPSGLISYKFDDGRYFPFPAEGRAQISINGNPTTLWYAHKIPGKDGEHFWHDAFGEFQTDLFGHEPGTNVENAALKELQDKDLAIKIEKGKEKFKSIKTKKITLSEWLKRDAQKHRLQSVRDITAIHEKQKSQPSIGDRFSSGLEQGVEEIFSTLNLPLDIINKILSIEIPVED